MSEQSIPKSPSQTSRQDRDRATAWSSQRLYRPYVKWALVVAVTLGFSTGTVMLVLPALDHPTGKSGIAHLQAHGVAQLFGWAGLFIMGLAFHIVPRLRNVPIVFPWPQRIALALILLGIGGRFIGQTAGSLGINATLLVASGVSLVLGVGLFAVVIGQALRRGSAPHSPSEAWLWMSLFWSVVAAGLHLATVVQMASGGSLEIAPARHNGAMVHVALVGFIASFVFGISLRFVSAFLALPPTRLIVNRVSLLAVNAGIALTAVGWLMGFEERILAIGAVLELLGFASFVAGLRVYSHRVRPRVYTLLRFYGRYEWYLRTAYAWLLVAGSLQAWNALGNVWPTIGPPSNLAAPALHVLTLGFVTMIIMGMASRMLPLFEGAVLPWHGVMDVVFALLNASVLLRLVFGIVPTGIPWVGLAVSGSLGTLAMICFSLIIWRTLQPASRRMYVEMALAFGQQQMAQARQRQELPNP